MFLPKKTVPNWVDPIVYLKNAFVHFTDRGDIPPAAIAERDGKVLAIVCASQVSRDAGLHLAHLLRFGLGIDHITIAFDAHMYKSKPGETYEDYRKKYPPGSMQKECDEKGACERGELIDCLTIHRVSAGKYVAATLPYHYHGKGTDFRWAEEDFQLSDEISQLKLVGVIPETLGKIITGPMLIDTPKGELMARMCEVECKTREEKMYHSSRAALMAMEMDGCIVMNFLEADTPATLETVIQHMARNKFDGSKA
jgi:hypothetical protein